MGVNTIENRKTIQEICKPKSWFFEKKINKIGKPLYRLNKKQITKIRNERGTLTTEFTEIKGFRKLLCQ